MAEDQFEKPSDGGFSKRTLLVGATALATSAVFASFGVKAARPPLGPLPSVDRLKAIDPARYPSLSKRAMGMLEYQYRKATAAQGDWSLWEPSQLFDGKTGIGGTEREGTQYDLFSSSLAVANAVDKTPAYREFAETVLGGIAEKGHDDRSWRYWTENRDGSGNNGVFTPYSADPIPVANAMYVGNHGGALAYYALMTDNRRFDKPQDYVYRGPGVEIAGRKISTGMTWSHSWKDLVESVSKQMVAADNRMVMCQVPTIYFVCNLSIAQTLLAYDKVIGGGYSEILYGRDGFFARTGEQMFDPPRSSGKAPEKIIFGKKLVEGAWRSGPQFSVGDIFLTYGLYPTKPDWALDTYAMSKRLWLREEADGLASWAAEGGGHVGGPPLKALATSLGAVIAATARDTDTRRRTVEWMERNYSPTWDGDMLVYKMVYDDPADYLQAGGMQSGMLAVEVMDDGSPMANFDIDRRRFREPTISGAPYPEVKVSRATFDRDASALVATLSTARATTFNVTNLQPGAQAVVLMNGEVVHRGQAPADPRGLRIALPSGTHDFVIGVQFAPLA